MTSNNDKQAHKLSIVLTDQQIIEDAYHPFEEDGQAKCWRVYAFCNIDQLPDQVFIPVRPEVPRVTDHGRLVETQMHEQLDFS